MVINKPSVDELYIDDEMGGQLVANYLANYHKIKKFVYIPLLTSLAIATLAGAGCDGEKAVVEPNPIRLVNGYENQLDLNSVMMYTALGQVSISTEKEYVSHGNASAKVTVMADPFYGVYDNYTPRLYQAMNI